MNTVVCSKTMQNMRNKIDESLVNNKKLFEMDNKTVVYVTKNIQR